jgi:hypothetical protein
VGRSSLSSTRLQFRVVEDEADVEEDTEVITIDSGSGFLKKLSTGIVPLAASLGFAVTPSSTIAYRVAGAAAGGLAGLVARTLILKKLSAEELERARANDNGGGAGMDGIGGGSLLSPQVEAALEYLINGQQFAAMNLKDLEKVAKKFKVPNDELGQFITFVFSEVIFAAIQGDSSDLTVLSEVIDFAVDVELTPSEIGDGFALAATKLGRQLSKDPAGFFAASYPSEVLLQASKIFFLADKMIGSTQGYYGKRLSTALYYFTPEMYKEQVTAACSSLFKKCIESVLVSPDGLTAEEVQELREYLSGSAQVTEFRPANMQNMILEALQFKLDNAIRAGMFNQLWNPFLIS